MSKTMVTLLGALAVTVAGCWCRKDPCDRDDDERGWRSAWHRDRDGDRGRDHDDDDDDREVCIEDGGRTADAGGTNPGNAAPVADGGGAIAADAGTPGRADVPGADVPGADACHDPAPNP